MHFKSFRAKDGLSQNSVYQVLQDNEGIFWVATIDGLNRFDGVAFSSYRPIDSALPQVSSEVLAVSEYDQRYLLVGTANGLLFFDKVQRSFVLPVEIVNGLEELTNLGVSEILKSGPDEILILVKNKGLFYLDKKRGTLQVVSDKATKIATELPASSVVYYSISNQIFKYDLSTSTTTSVVKANDKIKSFCYHKERFYIATVTNKVEVRNLIGELIDVPFFETNRLAVSAFGITRDDHLLIGTRDAGLYQVDLTNYNVSVSHDDHLDGGLYSPFVLSIMEDKDGNVWVGTSGGGFACNLDKLQRFTHIRPADKVGAADGNNMVFGMQEMTNGQIALGSLLSGLQIYDPVSEKMVALPRSSLPTETRNVYSVVQIGTKLYMATWHGLVTYDTSTKTFADYDGRHPANSKLYVVEKMSDTELVLSGENGTCIFDWSKETFADLDIESKATSPMVCRYARKVGDLLYLASRDNGLLVYDIDKMELRTYKGLSDLPYPIRHFYLGEKYLWVATEGGLMQADQFSSESSSGDLVRLWDQKSGLANGFVYAVLEDDEGMVWLSTNRGISSIDPETDKVVNYELIDGLQDYEYNTASALRSEDGTLLFGGINGLNIIRQSDSTHYITPTAPQLSSVKINNRSTTWQSVAGQDYIVLPPDDSYLSIRFATPYHWTGKIHYQYKLSKLHTEWQDIGQQNQLDFFDLRTGKYELKLKANILGSDSSEVSNTIMIDIQPKWYETWWFTLVKWLAGLATLLMIILFTRHRRLQKQEFEKSIMELESKALRSQMNPHFIFNTLNSIKAYAIFNTKDETAEYITIFATLIRNILSNSTKKLISLQEEIRLLTLYLQVENRRTSNAINVNIEVDPEINTERALIPPMILQPLIENALWHGLLMKTGDKDLMIRFEAIKTGFTCTVLDNGVGRSNKVKSNQSIRAFSSLNAIRQRIQNINTIYKSNCSLEIIDLQDDKGCALGTKAIVVVDIKAEELLTNQT